MGFPRNPGAECLRIPTDGEGRPLQVGEFSFFMTGPDGKALIHKRMSDVARMKKLYLSAGKNLLDDLMFEWSDWPVEHLCEDAVKERLSSGFVSLVGLPQTCALFSARLGVQVTPYNTVLTTEEGDEVIVGEYDRRVCDEFQPTFPLDARIDWYLVTAQKALTWTPPSHLSGPSSHESDSPDETQSPSMPGTEFLPGFRLIRLRFTAEARETHDGLPPFKGWAIRGALGRAMQAAACVLDEPTPQGAKAFCQVCEHRHTCFYVYAFDTSQSLSARDVGASDGHNAPRPFTLRAPETKRVSFGPGDIMDIGLSLFGNAVELVPEFVDSVVRMLEDGWLGRDLARNRDGRRWRVLRVVTLDSLGLIKRQIYDARWGCTHADEWPHDVLNAGDVVAARQCPQSPTRVRVELLSPLNLKFTPETEGSPDADQPNQRTLLEPPPFSLLTHAALYGVRRLYDSHCGGLFPQGIRDRLVPLARNVALTKHRWETPRIGRTRALVGTFEYEGTLAPFVPWFALAEQTHIGHDTVKGLGRIQVDFTE